MVCYTQDVWLLFYVCTNYKYTSNGHGKIPKENPVKAPRCKTNVKKTKQPCEKGGTNDFPFFNRFRRETGQQIREDS